MIETWVNIAASNNAWSNGLTPAHIAKLAFEAPRAQVFDMATQSPIGWTGEYEVRAEGKELWSLCNLEREPEGAGKWHAEAVLMRHPDGRVELGMVCITTLPRGTIGKMIAGRHPGKVGRL